MDYGLIVDTETTGLDPNKDKIIEIGLLEFAVEEGAPSVITEMYSGIEDPQIDFDPKIEKITGLYRHYLINKKINWELVTQFFNRASIIIAHHAEFDFKFLSKINKLNVEKYHWACSIEHIDWASHNFKSTALNYLAADHGFINPFAHRALFDCATTFKIISPYLKELIENSYKKRFKIWASNVIYEYKDQMKNNGYKWDNSKNMWYKKVFEENLEKEKNFLITQIYQTINLPENFIIQEEIRF